MNYPSYAQKHLQLSKKEVLKLFQEHSTSTQGQIMQIIQKYQQGNLNANEDVIASYITD